MNKILTALIVVCCITAVPVFAGSADNALSLAGKWNFSLDPDNVGLNQKWYGSKLKDTIDLPGTTDQARYGTKTQGSTYGALSRLYTYKGPAWYQKQIKVPKKWKNRSITLYLERCLWQSDVWLDDKKIGTYDSLGTPHTYNLGKLKPGKHTLTVRIDNSMIHNIGEKGHAYGDHMQTIWNGIIGRIELHAIPVVSIDSLRIAPSFKDKTVLIDAAITNALDKTQSTRITCTISDVDTGKTIAQAAFDTCDIPAGTANKQLEIQIPADSNIVQWDEFTPVLYDLQVTVATGKKLNKPVDTAKERFGFRTITHDGDHFVINGNKTFMRGNLDNCHFPLTGYPAMDVAAWERIFNISKSYGINNIRFHSWCPPEAAFTAADKVGIYLQPEVGIWIDKWMLAKAPGLKLFGKEQDVVDYAQAELDRIIETYGNHPSFVMLSIGNELGGGDFELMAKMMNAARDADPRRLYACSTARNRPPTDDYFVSHATPKGGTRGLRGPRTDWDYSRVLEGIDVPVIAHELGQWPVYPDFAEIDKYTGTLRARNIEEFRDSATKNNLLHQNKDFQKASGALNILLYKAEIEASMRTPAMAGFHLLGLQDYSGQGEALIGTLDSFYDTKGLTTPEKFRTYCSPTVPLISISKFNWTNDETLVASLQLAHFGTDKIENAFYWTLSTTDGKKLCGSESEPTTIAPGGITDLTNIRYPLSSIKVAQKLILEAGIQETDIKNSWDIWVFPADIDTTVPESLTVAETFDIKTIEKLQQGGSVLLFAPNSGSKDNTIKSRFNPVYWSLTWFAGQPGTLGNLIDYKHPALANFPTDFHTDWQWYSILQAGNNFILDDTPADFKPIVQTIDDFHRNHKLGAIFETKVGKGKLLVCAYDLHKSLENRPAAKQLLHSLINYASGPQFKPTHELSLDLLKQLLFTSVPAKTVKSPTGSGNASLFVKAAAKLETSDRDFPCDKKYDNILARLNGFKYSLKSAGSWKDSKGTYWFGKDFQLTIDCPQGFIGKLYVHYHDSNNLGRTGTVEFEGRKFTINDHKGDGKWLAFDVMREDTLDDKLILKSTATNGPNLMITEIALVPKQ